MSELSPSGGSEGYGACSDKAAAPLWSSWRVRSCRASPACWTPEIGFLHTSGPWVTGVFPVDESPKFALKLLFSAVFSPSAGICRYIFVKNVPKCLTITLFFAIK